MPKKSRTKAYILYPNINGFQEHTAKTTDKAPFLLRKKLTFPVISKVAGCLYLLRNYDSSLSTTLYR